MIITGKIKKFNSEKGFGFVSVLKNITKVDTKQLNVEVDVFFHVKSKVTPSDINEGDLVACVVTEGDKGYKAFRLYSFKDLKKTKQFRQEIDGIGGKPVLGAFFEGQNTLQLLPYRFDCNEVEILENKAVTKDFTADFIE